MSRHKKHLDFELNLVPFIDLLSACICFLLMTAVWTQVGSVDTKQAVGGQPASETEKKPTLWLNIGTKNELDIEIKDSQMGKKLSRFRVDSVDGKMNWEKLDELVKAIRSEDPGITTALIQPQASSVYEDIIDIMDRFKKEGIINLGVSPL